MKRRGPPKTLRLLSAACLLLTGCGGPGTLPSAPGVPSPFSGVQGTVRAGTLPVSGAAIKLYAAGAGGNGSAAQDLLPSTTLVTDAQGDFQLPSSYTCPASASQVYVVARGGSPGDSGSNNASLVLLAALGDCDSLNSSISVILNDVTTVAAAWALSPFLGSNASIAGSATNATGLRNAFLIAADLASIASGTAPGSLPAGASTETAKINSLANALAACSSSTGGSSCNLLFAAATVAGAPPLDTLDAALNIVRHPGSGGALVYNASLLQTPHQPALTAPPHDWTLSLTYGACSPGCGGLSEPADLAIDQAGNAWVANYTGGVLSKFSPSGTPAAPSGFPGVGLRESYGISIDPQGDVWVANQQSVTAANNSHLGSVSKFSPTGAELSAAGFTAGGIYFPQSIAAGSDGHIWVANYGASSATLLASDGTALSGSQGYAETLAPFVSAVALDAAHNAWFAAQGVAVHVTQAGAVQRFACCTYPTGIAVDALGNVWLADYNAYSIVELDAAGDVLHRVSTAAGNTAPQGIAIDGSGNLWTSNYYGDSVTEVSGSTAALVSPLSGFGQDAHLHEPYGIAVDASGDIWLSNSGSSTLTLLVGLATPVQTPVLGPPALP